MKAEELMIMDWVKVLPYREGVAPHNEQIKGIDLNCVIVPTLPHGNYAAFGYHNIEPVPLTAEILEKNGWEIYQASNGEPMYHTLHLSNCVLEYYWHLHRLTISPYDAEPWIKIVSSSYAHQLQHALRLCGLNDLANNFKI